MSAVSKRCLTPEEYLSIERRAETRSEYYRGEMFAMSGASRRHNLIAANILASLHLQFKQRSCEVYQSDMRVKIQDSTLYTYPDIVLTCSEPRFEDKEVDTLLNPQVIIEILSSATEAYDRGVKFSHYRKIRSLKQYLLVSQGTPMVEKYTRCDDDQWMLSDMSDLEGKVVIESVDCELSMAEIYLRVDIESEDAEGSL